MMMVVINRRRAVLRNDITFLDHDRCLLNHDRLDRPDPCVLHRVDHRFANALLMQRNDVADLQLPLNPAGMDLRDDHRIAQTASRHRNDVIRGNGRLDGGMLFLLLDINPLLLGIVLTLALLGDFLVTGIAQHGAADSPDRSTDRRPGTGFFVIFTDDSAHDRATESAQDRPSLGVLGERRPVPADSNADKDHQDSNWATHRPAANSHHHHPYRKGEIGVEAMVLAPPSFIGIRY